MPVATSKAVIIWQDKSAPSMPATKNKTKGSNGVNTRQQVPGSGVRWKCPACTGQHMYASARREIHLSPRMSAYMVLSTM